ncbi:carbohydrate kinase [Amylibacter marinus]|uniref:Carbohydrate kinase n=1 Tax=Amylibacter marinus TaxID=1475483 RepID=A0ABQ5VSV9_9RHOB|nr:carbohydrate kinase [Amylibacter marinus]GLQ34232.1 carbohydrate kinase [Amylibacter marinus]
MILCCGEALIDMVPKTLDDTPVFAPLSGGAVFNTAISLGRLQAPVALFSGISNDLFGNQLVSELKNSAVDTRYLARSNQPTTLAFVRLVDGHAQYTFYDENSAGRMVNADQIPKIDTSIDALYFGGISLCIEPAAETYAQALKTLGSDRLVMVDPNIRQSFIKDAAKYRARLMDIIQRADVVKVSDEDLDYIIEGPQSIAEKFATLKSMGPSIAILTKGSQGADALFGSNQQVSVPAVKSTVADTVGAGDSFNAGFLKGLIEGDCLSKSEVQSIQGPQVIAALKWATKVASITVSRSGANAPWLSELD